MKRAAYLLFIVILFAGLPAVSQESIPEKNAPTATTFTNPLLPVGPDPWVEYKDGFYYYMNTTATNLTLWKTRSMADLKSAEKKVVWTPPASGPYSRDIWAPEIHFLDGKWYIYFAADGFDNQTHRIWVVENPSPDPFRGEFTLKGKVSDTA
jgi:GH43 family beta-xylosidase